MRHLQIQMLFTTKLPCRIKCKFLAMTSKAFPNSAPASLSSLPFTTLLTLPSLNLHCGQLSNMWLPRTPVTDSTVSQLYVFASAGPSAWKAHSLSSSSLSSQLCLRCPLKAFLSLLPQCPGGLAHTTASHLKCTVTLGSDGLVSPLRM